MTTTDANPHIALLVANGFDEKHMTAVQRALTKAQWSGKIIAPEQGLVNGWQENAWGHYHTVDEQIGTALGSDFDMLILVGGERGATKLKSNPHTRRIVNHFLEAQKPVAAIETGVSLLALSPKAAGLKVASCNLCVADIEAARMQLVDETQTTDRHVLTNDGTQIESWVESLVSMIEAFLQESKEAA